MSEEIRFMPGQRVGVPVPGVQGLRQGVVVQAAAQAVAIRFDDGAERTRHPDELVPLPSWCIAGR